MKLHFLTSFCIGVHTTRRCPYRALLCDHENKRFILIVLREEPVQGDGRLGKALQHLYTRVWDKSPFSWGDESASHRVVALEVDWSSIVGIDYRCPLHDDGKLVLEARHVVKRCFKTVEDVRDYYSPRAATVSTGLRRGAFSAAPTPTKVSFEGRPLSRSGHAHPGNVEFAAGPARPFSCSSAFVTAVPEALNAVAGGTGTSGAAGAAGAAGAGRLVGSRSEAGPGCASRQGPTARSVSASRIGRACEGAAGAWGSHRTASEWRSVGAVGPQHGGPWGCAWTASEERPVAGRRQRGSGTGFAAARGGTETACAEGSASARRRLELREGGHACSVEQEAGAAVCHGESRKPMTRAEMVRIKHTEALSPRRARSAGDLVSLEPDVADTAQSRPSGNGELECGGGRVTCDGGRVTCDGAPHAGWAGRRPTGHGCGDGDAGERRSRAGAASCSSSTGYAELCGLGVLRSRGGTGHGHRRSRSSGRSCYAAAATGDAAHSASGGSAGGVEDVPRASRWTLPSASYRACTLALSFRDPFLPQELRRFVKSDLRLLKLYESGLPSWAVLMPCYGLPYRPWMRRALWLVFIAVSIFSMGCGFYDLYKNVPFLKQVVTAVASRLYLPAAELFEWLERHTQIRMSILLTYLFSKSPLLVSFMRALRSLAALLQQLLRPAMAALSGALQPLAAAARAAAGGLASGAVAVGGALWSAAQPLVAAAVVGGREVLALSAAVLGPPARLLWALALLLVQLGRLAASVVGMLLTGPLQLACSVGGALSWAGGALAEQLAAAGEAALWALQWVATLGRAARRVAPVVSEGARAAAAAAQAAGSAAAAGSSGGVGGGVAVWHWLGLEVVGAYNAVRLTFVQAFKSAKAVIDCLNALAQKAMQHRVSLLLQLRRFITRQKERLPPAVAASVPLPAFVTMPSFEGPTPGPPMSVLLEAERTLSDVDSVAGSPTATRHPVFDLDMLGDARGGEQPASGPGLGPALFDGDSDDGGGSGGEGVYGGDGGGGRTAPVAIPADGRAGGGGGLRRRRVGSDAGRLPPLAPRAGVLMYGLSHNRLDAVHEEAMDEDGEQDAEGLRQATRAGGPRRRSEPSGPHAGRSRLSVASHQPPAVRVGDGGGVGSRGLTGKSVRFAPDDSGPGSGSEEDATEAFEDFLGPASAPDHSAVWTAFAMGKGAHGGAALSSSVPSAGVAWQGAALGRVSGNGRARARTAASASQLQHTHEPKSGAALPPRGGRQRKQQPRSSGLQPQPLVPPAAGPGSGLWPLGEGEPRGGAAGGGGGGAIAAAVAANAAGGGAAAAAAAAAVAAVALPGAFTVLGGAFMHPDLVPLARHLRSSSAPLLVRPRSLSAPGDGPLGAFASGAVDAGAWLAAVPVPPGAGVAVNNEGGSVAVAVPGSSAPQCGVLQGAGASHIRQRRGQPLPVEAAC